MTTRTLLIGLMVLAGALPLNAELAPPNPAGVTMGQWSLTVPDMDASRKFWTVMGAVPAGKLGQAELMKVQNVVIALTPGTPSGTSVGSVINHVGFHVPDVRQSESKWKAAGLTVEEGNMNLPQIFLPSPEGVRVEVLEDKTMTVPLRHHHVHWNVSQATVPDIQAWYVQTFGAIKGMRGNFQAADIPGANLTFTAAGPAAESAPTRGRAFDHVGFEVANLEAFCKKLEALGVKFDQSYKKTGDMANAFLTDPWGTRIELTEGLSKR